MAEASPEGCRQLMLFSCASSGWLPWLALQGPHGLPSGRPAARKCPRRAKQYLLGLSLHQLIKNESAGLYIRPYGQGYHESASLNPGPWLRSFSPPHSHCTGPSHGQAMPTWPPGLFHEVSGAARGFFQKLQMDALFIFCNSSIIDTRCYVSFHHPAQ